MDRPHIRVIPEWFGGGTLPRKELHEAAEQLTASQAGLIALGEPTIACRQTAEASQELLSQSAAAGVQTTPPSCLPTAWLTSPAQAAFFSGFAGVTECRVLPVRRSSMPWTRAQVPCFTHRERRRWTELTRPPSSAVCRAPHQRASPGDGDSLTSLAVQARHVAR